MAAIANIRFFFLTGVGGVGGIDSKKAYGSESVGAPTNTEGDVLNEQCR